jgi:hypothetical protein
MVTLDNNGVAQDMAIPFSFYWLIFCSWTCLRWLKDKNIDLQSTVLVSILTVSRVGTLESTACKYALSSFSISCIPSIDQSMCRWSFYNDVHQQMHVYLSELLSSMFISSNKQRCVVYRRRFLSSTAYGSTLLDTHIGERLRYLLLVWTASTHLMWFPMVRWPPEVRTWTSASDSTTQDFYLID